MGEINFLAVLLGTVVFYAIGAVWYSALFRKPWMALTGVVAGEDGKPKMAEGGGPRVENPMWLIMLLTFLFEMLVVLVLGHLVARTSPSAHGTMMMAVGLGMAVMAPALGINYLYQARPGKLFAIDAGYFIVGMAAVGAVFLALS